MCGPSSSSHALQAISHSSCPLRRLEYERGAPPCPAGIFRQQWEHQAGARLLLLQLDRTSEFEWDRLGGGRSHGTLVNGRCGRRSVFVITYFLWYIYEARFHFREQIAAHSSPPLSVCVYKITDWAELRGEGTLSRLLHPSSSLPTDTLS